MLGLVAPLSSSEHTEGGVAGAGSGLEASTPAPVVDSGHAAGGAEGAVISATGLVGVAASGAGVDPSAGNVPSGGAGAGTGGGATTTSSGAGVGTGRTAPASAGVGSAGGKAAPPASKFACALCGVQVRPSVTCHACRVRLGALLGPIVPRHPPPHRPLPSSAIHYPPPVAHCLTLL